MFHALQGIEVVIKLLKLRDSVVRFLINCCCCEGQHCMEKETAAVMLGSCSVELDNIWSLAHFDYFILTLDTPVHVYVGSSEEQVDAGPQH